MKRNIIRNSILAIGVLMCVAMTGCGAKGSLYSKKVVLTKVSENIPSEKYEFVSVEPVPDADTSTEIYTFRSLERDMEFEAVNTRVPITYGAGAHTKRLQLYYDTAVHNYYRGRIDDIILHNRFETKKDDIFVTGYNDLSGVSQMLAEADDVYKEERQFNTEKWMASNPAVIYSIRLPGTNKRVCGVPINGTWDVEKLYGFLEYSYATLAKTGEIEDSTIPRDVIAKGHVKTLQSIIIDGVNISENAYQNAKAEHVYNNSHDIYYADYCYELGDYVIPIDCALTDSDYAPLIWEEVLGILADNYEISYKKGRILWECNGSKYVLKAQKDDDGIRFLVSKDGTECDIPYVVSGDWTSPITCTYIVGIRATDFANLMGLDMRVDEEEGVLEFTLAR